MSRIRPDAVYGMTDPRHGDAYAIIGPLQRSRRGAYHTVLTQVRHERDGETHYRFHRAARAASDIDNFLAAGSDLRELDIPPEAFRALDEEVRHLRHHEHAVQAQRAKLCERFLPYAGHDSNP